MQSLTTEQYLLIPLEFALTQIEGLNIAATLAKLKHLKEQVIRLSIEQDIETELTITDFISVGLTDILELFSGEHGDLVTANGAKLLKRMHDEVFLEFTTLPREFPMSLIDYSNTADIDSSVSNSRHNRSQKTASKLLDISESEFNYSNLFYLFELMVGSKQGKTTLKIDGRNVTRSTIRNTNHKKGTEIFETVFLWENNACRTQYCRRHKI